MKRLAITTVLALGGALASTSAHAAAATPAPAVAESPLRVFDTGTHVAIDVRGVSTGHAVRWLHGKLQLTIDDKPGKLTAESVEDATIKRIALVGGEKPRVVVIFRHGSRVARQLTEATKVEPTGHGFRVLIPRKETLFPPPTPAVEAEPEPVAEAEPVAEPAAVEVPTTAEPAIDVVIEDEDAQTPTPDAEETPDALPLHLSEDASEGSDDDEVSKDDPLAAASTTDAGGPWMSILTSLAMLAACGGALWWARRRKGALPGALADFKVLGNQPLGGKTRLVLLGLDERRMLLAISEQATTVVDKWSENAGTDPPAAIASSRIARLGDELRSAPLAAVEFDSPAGNLGLGREPNWVEEETRGRERARRRPARPEPEAAPEAHADTHVPDAESSAVTGLLELRRRERARHGSHGDKWVDALAAQLRAGDAH